MKKTIYLPLFIAYVALCLTAFYVTNHKTSQSKAEVIPTQKTPEPTLNHQQKAWLGALEWCESKGKPSAVNPKDRDNTPSYGILQFKPSTLAYFKKQYGITGELMNPDTQEAIVTQMILKGGINWAQQFLDCTKKLGTPPKISTL